MEGKELKKDKLGTKKDEKKSLTTEVVLLDMELRRGNEKKIT